uniref:(northern house mosquito) hypothetical protein n=1 Tax=Culex pipiens TaxID=7175 RepID=A0A8D8DZ78_CULPI
MPARRSTWESASSRALASRRMPAWPWSASTWRRPSATRRPCTTWEFTTPADWAASDEAARWRRGTLRRRPISAWRRPSLRSDRRTEPDATRWVHHLHRRLLQRRPALACRRSSSS